MTQDPIQGNHDEEIDRILRQMLAAQLERTAAQLERTAFLQRAFTPPSWLKWATSPPAILYAIVIGFTLGSMLKAPVCGPDPVEEPGDTSTGTTDG